VEKVFKKTSMLTDAVLHYCPGCTHGIIHRLVAESLEELGVGDRAIGVAPVGCAVFAYDYFNCDMHEAAHGRAPAVATGSEIVHAAARGEKITTIFVNNAIYGMTGGQMAPTTLVGQKATTAPGGRNAAHCGYPVRVSELLATLDGAAYIERVSMQDVANVIKAKKAIRKAFECQLEGRGFSLVEVLSTCPTNWGLSPVEALGFLKDSMVPYYPLGVKKEV